MAISDNREKGDNNMVLKNDQIYNYCLNIKKAFENETRHFPAKINFIIQYNLKQLLQVGEAIQEAINKIQREYGNEEGKILGKNEELANAELAELSAMKENIEIKKIKLNDLNGIEFTPQQMNAILFMIEDE